MSMDINILATTIVTTFLIPYVKLGIENVITKVSERFSDAAAKHIGDVGNQIWVKVKSAFSSPQDEATLSQFKEYPDEAKALVEAILKKKLEQDPQLAEELEKLVNLPSSDGITTGAQIMSASIAGILDARGATISGSGNKMGGVIIEGSATSQAIDQPPEEKSKPE